MPPAVGLGLFVAVIVGLHVLQWLGGVLRAIAAEAEKASARRDLELQARLAEAERQDAREQRGRRPAQVRRAPTTDRRRPTGPLGAHHLQGGIDARHLSAGIDARHLTTHIGDPDAPALPELGAGDDDAPTTPTTGADAVSALPRLQGLSPVAQAFVLSEVFSAPRGRVRPRLLGVRAVDG